MFYSCVGKQFPKVGKLAAASLLFVNWKLLSIHKSEQHVYKTGKLNLLQTSAVSVLKEVGSEPDKVYTKFN